MDRPTTGLYEDLVFLYRDEEAHLAFERLKRLLTKFRDQYPQLAKQPAGGRVSEEDSVIITYGDMVSTDDEAPLHTLAQFLKRHLSNTVNTVHILPFFPYSSDDGFSVIDYQVVDPDLGEWKNIAEFGDELKLMFDAVINHISAGSAWFQGFLGNEKPYNEYFTIVEPGTDLSRVFRPRALPLLTPVQQASGDGGFVERLVWSTFSADQIDLNYQSPDLLLDILEVLLFYVSQGAQFIRLDAIAFIWKEIGTSCIHLPQAHRLIQMMRKVLDQVAPGVALITETNVPHKDNVSYFGDGTNEAQMVYNFSLPPLTLHAFHTGNAQILSRWAEMLTLPSDQVSFFNFLASHDGIGVTPARGFLTDKEITDMANRVRALGGYVSEKANPNGSTSPYELNINYMDALADPDATDEELELVADRFLASQAIMLALQGVPGIYFHSLFGSRGWPAGVTQTGRNRTVNRQKLDRDELEKELEEDRSLRRLVFDGYRNLLRRRRENPAFHPNGEQQVLFIHEALFSLARTSPDGLSQIICLHNVYHESLQVSLNLSRIPLQNMASFTDLISGQKHLAQDGQMDMTLRPYQVLWLAAD